MLDTESVDREQGTKYIVDLAPFEHVQDHKQCSGDHNGNCKRLDRVIEALDYHQYLRIDAVELDAQSAFRTFCDEHYAKKTMIDDYIHFVLHHADSNFLDPRSSLGFPWFSRSLREKIPKIQDLSKIPQDLL